MCNITWLCGNSCTWAHDVRLHIAGTNEPTQYMVNIYIENKPTCNVFSIYKIRDKKTCFKSYNYFPSFQMFSQCKSSQESI